MKNLIKHCCEFGPLAVFFILFKKHGLSEAIFPFILSSILGLLIMYFTYKKISIMTIVSTSLLALFGGLTLLFNNKIFFYMKPTILYIIFGLVLWGGLFFNRYFLKYLFQSFLELTNQGWKMLTHRFVIFFFLMAILNESIWRTQTEQIWVSFKVFGFTSLTVAFMLFQYPLMKKYLLKS